MPPVQVSDTHQRLVVELDDIQDSPESEQTERGGCGLEIQTKAIQRGVITEKALEGALSMITNLLMDFFEALCTSVGSIGVRYQALETRAVQTRLPQLIT